MPLCFSSASAAATAVVLGLVVSGPELFSGVRAAASADNDDCSAVDASGAVLSASHSNTVNSNEDFSRAFDSDATSKWLVYEAVQEPVWVQAVLPTATTVTKYAIVSADDAPERDPASWEVAASNDGVYFVTLDVQTGAVWDERLERKVFSISHNSAAYTHYRFDFNSVRDMDVANSLQLSSIALYEGDCEDACCGIDCGANGECSDGTCVCNTGYEGSSCETVSENWAVYSGRAISGATPSSTTTVEDLDACKEVCVAGNDESACVGVNFNSASGACDVVSGALSGWALASSSAGSDASAALLVSANLHDGAEPESQEVVEQVAYTVDWNSKYHQMPRIDMFIGESVTFQWEDVNLRNLPQHSASNHHNVYLFAGEAQYQRCDFRAAKVVAVAPTNVANVEVTWTSTTEGKYYFGSSYGTDCSEGQLKMIVQVERRPAP